MQEFAFWYSLSLLIAMTVILVSELIEADIAIFSVLILFILGGVIDLKEAFNGFSNQGMLTILHSLLRPSSRMAGQAERKSGGGPSGILPVQRR